MGNVKPVKGRRVWKVCSEVVPDDQWPEGPRGLMSLYGGKMFATKGAAERFGVRMAFSYPRFFGEITVQEYTCTGKEWGAQFEALLAGPWRGK